MLNSSLIEILKTFDKDELKRFEDLVDSPYYNKKSNVRKLYKAIKKYLPDSGSSDLNREAVYTRIFPGKEYNYGVMKNLIFSLQKLAEKFIELEYYDVNKYEQKKNLLDGLMRKQLLTHYEKNLKAAKSDISKSVVDPDYYHYKFIFEAKEQNYFYQFRKAKEPGFCKPFEMSESLSSAFFTSFFTENYNSLLESRFYNKSYDTEFISVVFNFFENSLSKNDEQVRLFYYSLKILKNPDDDESFYLLKQMLKKNLPGLYHRISFNVSMSLINYSNYQLMRGKLRFIDDQYEICRFMVESKLLLFGDNYKHIDGSLFVKVVSSACSAGECVWAEKFIEEHKDLLKSDDKESSLLLALITLNIKTKNFDAAMQYLSKADVKEMIQKINVKRYQVMIYYELGYVNELYSYIDTSKHFISNDNKTSDAVKNTFFNFISFVNRLLSYKIKLPKSRVGYELTNLKKDIESMESPNKIWLLEKVTELEEGNK